MEKSINPYTADKLNTYWSKCMYNNQYGKRFKIFLEISFEDYGNEKFLLASKIFHPYFEALKNHTTISNN